MPGEAEPGISQSIFAAAEREEWLRLDNDFIPKLIEGNQHELAKELLDRVGDENPNIRDAVATGIAVLTITDPELKERTVQEMIRMATEDPEISPSGRAAVVLLKYKKDPACDMRVDASLNIFKTRVRQNEWTQKLTEDIPTLKEIF